MPSLPPFPLRPRVQDRLGRLGLEFLADVLGRETRRNPENVEALAELAQTLTCMGRLEEGLAADERLVVLVPEDPTVRYNLACSLALLGLREPALAALARAIELGYDDPQHLECDEDLESLRNDVRFTALVARLQTD